MRKRIRSFTLGYFTNDIAKALMRSLSGGYPRPAAVHIEPQSTSWALASEYALPGQPILPGRHAEFCTNLLAGDPHKGDSWDTGYMDEFVKSGRPAFFAAAIHPNIRVITISSQENKVPPYGYRDYRDLSGPVILKAAGNGQEDWLGYQKTATLSGEVYAPGYVRVGECLPTGEIYSGSQASGPAFVCDHPRNVSEVMGNVSYYATKEDISSFLAWPHHGIPEDCAAVLAAYNPPEEPLKEFFGTSASAPYAGMMIMRATMNMDGITAYDILPALLMAAQTNAPPPVAKRLVETQSGMIFDPFHYGHGVLVEECLSQALGDVWKIRSMSGKMTRAGDYSRPVTVEGRGRMSARTDRAEGPVVNTVLSLSFLNDESDPGQTEARMPQYIMLQSPSGTLIHLPLLFDRKSQYGPFIRAGYQTSAFFGEDISKGEWRIAYSKIDENPLRIASMKIVAHTMHPKSPALVLFRGFQKASAAERGEDVARPAFSGPGTMKPV